MGSEPTCYVSPWVATRYLPLFAVLGGSVLLLVVSHLLWATIRRYTLLNMDSSCEAHCRTCAPADRVGRMRILLFAILVLVLLLLIKIVF